MKSFLLHRDQNFDLKQPLPANQEILRQDLELDTLFKTMAAGDAFIRNVIEIALLCGLDDPEAIRYRQDILKDCLKNPEVIREIYHIPVVAETVKKERWMGFFGRYPRGILDSSIDLMNMFLGLLKRLRAIADEKSGDFESEGFVRFFKMIQTELDEVFFATAETQLKELKFRDGVLLSAELGRGNEGQNYILRKPSGNRKNWLKEIFSFNDPSYSFYVNPRDDGSMRTLAELKDLGINLVANVVAQSSDHIDNFLQQLRIELAFYVACLNLSDQLSGMNCPVAIPVTALQHERRHAFRGLYDVGLALTMKKKPVGNDLTLNGKDMVIVTGANQGGKSTFLRSIGLSQLMMQCGMFVPAEEFEANLCRRFFTHYKREEDSSMVSGKLDEELNRMNEIIDQIQPNGMVLFNESFMATNEREGSEIARQITSALLDRKVKIFFVTHLYEFASSISEQEHANVAFLRAERKEGGKRTFHVREGEPLETSYGEDLYRAVFSDADRV